MPAAARGSGCGGATSAARWATAPRRPRPPCCWRTPGRSAPWATPRPLCSRVLCVPPPARVAGLDGTHRGACVGSSPIQVAKLAKSSLPQGTLGPVGIRDWQQPTICPPLPRGANRSSRGGGRLVTLVSHFPTFRTVPPGNWPDFGVTFGRFGEAVCFFFENRAWIGAPKIGLVQGKGWARGLGLHFENVLFGAA